MTDNMIASGISRVQPDTYLNLAWGADMTFAPQTVRSSPAAADVPSTPVAQWCSHGQIGGLDNILQLRRILRAFPQLEDLTVTKTSVTQRPLPDHTISTPCPMRLRHLDIDVRGKAMALCIDWMSQSGCFDSLEHLTIWSDDGFARRSVHTLLEAAGPSLTRYRGRYWPHHSHGDLSQNIALQSVELRLTDVYPQAGGKAPDAWSKAEKELRDGILSTIRSPQLDHIGVTANIGFDDRTFKQFSAALGQVNLGKLHAVMCEPYYDALRDVEVEVGLYRMAARSRKTDVDDVGLQLEALFLHLLRPWSDRGIVNVSQRRPVKHKPSQVSRSPLLNFELRELMASRDAEDEMSLAQSLS
ncbi:uncharacterized protein B0H18DRAFT_989250 [Fomitopsis serialis]|uniref:uncharacterized protein n=1 Tax=Fomitopsis serialis TaxID=139415 RepID=UPI002007D7CB|nr:uncharacterized protein B0H18DRAFT_989250 [Neoantrodia serialis]KAH9931425.1 hypothetical protein B0H18DRAFT_989250 [Neoantrodia serialis]